MAQRNLKGDLGASSKADPELPAPTVKGSVAPRGTRSITPSSPRISPQKA